MPSAMVGNSAAQSAILDLGSGSQNDTMKQVLGVVDKKLRNMEKKKVSAAKRVFYPSHMDFFLFLFQHFHILSIQSKLDDYQAKKNKGERLNQDQLVRLNNWSKKQDFSSWSCWNNKKSSTDKDIVYLHQMILSQFILRECLLWVFNFFFVFFLFLFFF